MTFNLISTSKILFNDSKIITIIRPIQWVVLKRLSDEQLQNI